MTTPRSETRVQPPEFGAAIPMAWWPSSGPWRGVWQRFRRNRNATIGALVLLAIVAASIGAPLLAVYPPNTPLDLIGLKSQGPSWSHPFGTDPVSRDVLSRVLYGSRVSLIVAVLAMLTQTTVGTVYGAVAGYASGWVDEVMMRITDACLS